MKLIKKLGVSLWWSCIAGLVGMFVAAVLIVGPDVFPAPSPADMPPDLRKLIQPASVHAQGRDNVFQRVFNAVTVSQISAPLRNNGQSQHILSATWTGPGTCTPGVTSPLFFEGSYDSTNWFPVGSQQTIVTTISPTNSYRGQTIANGTFPYIRINFTQTSTCTTTVWYTGAIVPVTDTLAAWQYAFVSVGGSPGPFTNQLLVGSIAGKSIVVYSLYVDAAGTAPSQFNVQWATDNTCVTASDLAIVNFAAATGQYARQNSIPVMTTPVGAALCYDQTGTMTGVISATYRYE